MDPVSVSARNYRNWRSVSWEIPVGCTAIVGGNGAGKSSLVNLVSLCLFGGRDLARSVTRGESELEVSLRFSHRGAEYRVRRWCQLGARARTGVIFERLRGGMPPTHEVWEVVGAESIRATDEVICRTLGVDRRVFHASSFLGQGEGAVWTRADPRERKRVLADVLGLGVWERVNARAVAALRIEQVEAERVAAEAGHLEALVGRGEWARDHVAELRVRLEETRGALAVGRAAFEAHREWVAARRELEAWRGVAAPTVEERRLAARRGDLEVLQLTVRDLQHARLERDGLAERLERDRRAWRVVDAALEAVEERLVAVRRAEVCDACGQPLPADRLEARVAALEEAATDAVDQAQKAAGQVEAALRAVEACDARIDVLEETVRALPRELAERIRVAAERVARWDALPVARLAELRARLPGLEEAAGGGPGEAVSVLEERVERLVGEVGREQAAVDAGDEAAARLGVVRGEAALRRRDGEALEVLVRASGRDGVPLRVVDAVALPRVSEVANRVLDGLGGGFRVELRSQRATMRGEARDALDVVVHADGGEAAYEELSGGERTRVDLALRLGLASLLAARRGAEVGVLVVDEPDWLDAAGLERLAVVLAGGVGGAYRRVLVVSHAPGLADAFDRTVRVSGSQAGPVLLDV